MRTAQALVNGDLDAGDSMLDAGRLGMVEVVEGKVRVVELYVFNSENINNFDF